MKYVSAKNPKNIPLAFSYDDVLLVPQKSNIESRSDVDLTTKISPNLTLKIPLISTKMDTVTGVNMAIEMGKMGGLGILPRFEPIDSQASKVKKVKKAGVNVAAAVGIKPGFLKRADALVKAGATVIDIDVAHGHMDQTIKATRMLRKKYGNKITILSGITSTYECAKDLYKAGADCVLVGVGGGSTCTTRIMTGFGVPMITSLLETARAAKEFKKTFVPDAGIKNSGDIVKSLAVGASAIVSGYLFAGTKEAPGRTIKIKNRKYKKYHGSASETEKARHKKNNLSNLNGNYTIHIEGVEGFVEYRGPVKNVVIKLLAGVKSGFAYAGAKNMRELWRKAKLVRITSAGWRESNAHDILERK